MIVVAPNAGTLDQRVSIERPIEVQDEAGSIATSWQPLRTVWAAVRPLRGREIVASAQPLSVADVAVTIRWAQDLARDMTTKWRLVHRGRPYNIAAISETGMAKERLEIVCSTGASEG